MNTNVDYSTMGLAHYQPGQNAFQSVPPKRAEKPCTAPKKTGPKQKPKTMTAKGQELAEQRRALDTSGRATVHIEPRTIGAITIHSKADTDRRARLRRGKEI